jgi:O-antigen biosynthesis protein
MKQKNADQKQIDAWRQFQLTQVALGKRVARLWTYYQLRDRLRRLWMKQIKLVSNADPTGTQSLDQIPKILGKEQKAIWIFPSVTWHSIRQRPQQLARVLASVDTVVLYVEPAFTVDSKSPVLMQKVLPHVWRIILPVPQPIHFYSQILPSAWANDLANQLQAVQTHFSRKTQWSAIFEHPFWTPLLTTAWQPRRTVYDCIDDLRGFAVRPPQVEKWEKRLIQLVTAGTATHPKLVEHCQKLGKSAALIPNGVEYQHFSLSKHKTSPLSSLPAPRAGYYGMMDTWFDRKLVTWLAITHPNWQFVLMGPVTDPRIWQLAVLKNVLFTGPVAYEDLPSFVQDCTAMMIPFRKLPITAATNPVKLYEMLAAGKPIISSALSAVEAFSMNNLVRIAHKTSDWGVHLDAVLHDSPKLVRQRRAVVMQETWSARAQAMMKVLYGKSN